MKNQEKEATIVSHTAHCERRARVSVAAAGYVDN